jgi:type I restriction enzyme S subunit
MGIPLPPISEQIQIVQRIEAEVALFDSGIDRLKREIAFLREYRVRLTTDVITGKLDVCLASACLPGENEHDDGGGQPDEEDTESELTDEEAEA